MTADCQGSALRFIPSIRVGCSDEPAAFHSSQDGTEPGESTRAQAQQPRSRVNTTAPRGATDIRHAAAVRAMAAAAAALRSDGGSR